MSVSKSSLIESRLTALEGELARLKSQLGKPTESSEDWLDKTYGAFANDPGFDEMVELGRKYRESLRPKPSRKKSGKTIKDRRRQNVRT